MPAAALRRALLLVLATTAAAASLAACGGGGGDSSSASSEKAADAEILNQVLSRQSAAVAAYDHGMRAFGRYPLAMARQFRTQEQEHVDATLKALRGLGAAADPTPEEIDAGDLKSAGEYLTFLYELESATIEAELTAIARLSSAGARALLTGTVANQAQHLVLLRRALGAKSLQSIPSAFEVGTTPAP